MPLSRPRGMRTPMAAEMIMAMKDADKRGQPLFCLARASSGLGASDSIFSQVAQIVADAHASDLRNVNPSRIKRQWRF